MTTSKSPNETALDRAKAELQHLQAKLDADATATARADQLATDAADKLAGLERDRARLQGEAGDALAAQITAGLDDDLCIHEDTTNVLIATAKTTAAITANAAKKLRDRHSATLSEFYRASATVGLAADAVLFDVAEERAKRFKGMWDAMAAEGNAIRAMLGTGLDIPIHIGKRVLPDSVREALLLVPATGGIHTPVSVLRGEVSQGDTWATLKKKLIDE